MREILELGFTTPSGEQCAQVGSINYGQNARKEGRALINLIKREFGEPPTGVSLELKSNPHDFGTYLDVVIRYDGDSEEHESYALRVEADCPEYWDDEAKKELNESGYEWPKNNF